MSKSILFITNMYPTQDYPVDGIFIKEQIEDLAQELKCRYDIYVINAKRKNKLFYLKSLIQLPFKILKKKYDIIHIHYGISALFLLLFRPKCRTFLTLHGGDILKRPDNFLQILLTKRILSKVNKVFTQNIQMHEIAKHFNPNVEIIPCGVNVDFFKPNPSKESFIRPHTKLIVFPNSPSRNVKNFPLFKEVINYLNQHSQYTFEFACVDRLSRAEVRDLFSIADCLLMTSISEGSPQVIKEALSCGLPVVSVPVGDVSAMIENIPHCFVSHSFSPTELSNLVELTYGFSRSQIREKFISKGEYDHHSITGRIARNYIQ